MVETLNIATIGTLMTLALAFPLGVLAARNIVANPLARYGAKLCLDAPPSGNSLVWALLFVAEVGPGALVVLVAVFAVVLFAEVAVTAIRKRVL